MIQDLYFLVKDILLCLIQMVTQSPRIIFNQIKELVEYAKQTKKNTKHILNTNLELGLLHLYNNKFNDAIFRFKLVDILFNPGNKFVYYWLGWCYFMKNNYDKSLLYFSKSNEKLSDAESKEINTKELIDFIKNYKEYINIPMNIWNQFRDIHAINYAEIFITQSCNLSETFIKYALSKADNIDSNYNILELGSNIGIVGQELRKRFPGKFYLKGVESSEEMINICNILHNDKESKYNDLVHNDMLHFLQDATQTSQRFEIILSFCYFTFSSKLSEYFKSISDILTTNGYFIFLLPFDSNLVVSLEDVALCFSEGLIRQELSNCNLDLLDSKIVSLENKKFIIYCTNKIQG